MLIFYCGQVHGSDIPAMSEDDWKVLVSKKEIVFARTSPEQKLTIVKEFTKAGNVTAMTGDGVNDSPVTICIYFKLYFLI
jgi:sodium/potassium-transporting ATPase subunit alpha